MLKTTTLYFNTNYEVQFTKMDEDVVTDFRRRRRQMHYSPNCDPHHIYTPPEEKDLFFLAVRRDALRDFKCLAKVRSVNRTNNRGMTLLEHVINCKRLEIFDYMMTLDDLEIDRLDIIGQSPLIYSVQCSNEYYSLELIKKGANVLLNDNNGETALHMIVCKPFADRAKVGHFLIEKGADVNAQNNEGETPLYKACKAGNADWIFMLLYHGASATIPSNQEILPIAILCTEIRQEERLQLEDILFVHTFDVTTNSVQLGTLVKAMRLESALFTRIIGVVSDVSYKMHELEQLSDSLSALKPKHFELFLNKFSNIVSEMIKNYPPLIDLMENLVNYPTRNTQEILQLILESDHAFDLIQTPDSSDITIGKLIYDKLEPRQRKFEIEDEEMTKIVYIFLTYGFDVNSRDLDVVYKNYGYCDLFIVLLHMDIRIVDKSGDKCEMARLYYDPSTKIEEFCNERSVTVTLLCYYNHPKLKEVCLKKPVDAEVVAKARTLPTLPYLVELSRNAARCYIISRYRIQNSMQFYTVLKNLPIGEITKKIIRLEKELY